MDCGQILKIGGIVAIYFLLGALGARAFANCDGERPFVVVIASDTAVGRGAILRISPEHCSRDGLDSQFMRV